MSWLQVSLSVNCSKRLTSRCFCQVLTVYWLTASLSPTIVLWDTPCCFLNRSSQPLVHINVGIFICKASVLTSAVNAGPLTRWLAAQEFFNRSRSAASSLRYFESRMDFSLLNKLFSNPFSTSSLFFRMDDNVDTGMSNFLAILAGHLFSPLRSGEFLFTLNTYALISVAPLLLLA